ncbi:CPK2, partial [Symbiodinium necroappetens]
VPAPCPVGPMNQAINPKILDYPFMIGIGGEVVTTAPAVLLPFFFRNFRNGGGGDNMMVLQLTRFLWVGLTAFGAFCAFRRFVMMRQQPVGAGEVSPSTVAQGAWWGLASSFVCSVQGVSRFWGGGVVCL